MSPDRDVLRAALVELRDRGDAKAAEVEARLCATFEAAILAEAEHHKQASRDRRQAAREAQRRAQAELERELRSPLVERPAR